MRPRNGPPLAVSTIALGLAGERALEERRVLAVDRDQQPAAALARRERQLACGDEALLVRERERDAALERPHRRRQAGEAERGVEDDVGLRALEQLGRVAADLRQRREPVDRRRAAGRGDELERRVRARSPRSPGGRSSRWRRAGRSASPREVCRPRLPATRGCPALLAKTEDREVRGRGGEQERVEAVEHAAVAAEQARPSPSRPRRASGATRRGRRAARRPRGRPRARSTGRSRGSAACRGRRRRRRPSPRVPNTNPSHVLPGDVDGAILWRPEEASAEVRERVARPDGEQHREERQPAVVRQVARSRIRKPSPRPIHTAPSTVVETAAVGAWRAPRHDLQAERERERRRARRRPSTRSRRARRPRAPVPAPM